MRFWTCCLFFFLFISCHTYKTPEKAANRIEFSEGGGFTGAVKSWILADNGQIFLKLDTDTIFKIVKSISKKETDSIFNQAKIIFQTDRKLPKTPLNFSRSMRYYQAEFAALAIWSPGVAEYDELDKFYSKAIELLQKRNP